MSSIQNLLGLGGDTGGVGGSIDPAVAQSAATDLGISPMAYTGQTSPSGAPIGTSDTGSLGGLFGGTGQGGSQNTAQLLGLVQQLLHPNYPSFGGSFPGGVTLAGGRTSPLQFGAPSVGKESTPGERLAILMRSLG